MTAIVFAVFIILNILFLERVIMTSVGTSPEDSMEIDIFGQEDADFFDRMWQDLQVGFDRQFSNFQRHYDVDLRSLEPATVAYMNYVLKSTGVVIPIDNDLVSMDCTACIWQELCDIYPEEFLSLLHEATILQLYILLPYEIEEVKIQTFDSLNRAEFLEKPETRSFLDHDGVIRSSVRHGPLWGNELPVGVLLASVCDASFAGGGGGGGGGGGTGVDVNPPVVAFAEAVVDSTLAPAVAPVGGKKSLPAEPSGKAAPSVLFFNPRSSTAKREQLQVLESDRLTLQRRLDELSDYIEEGKRDLKEISHISFAGEADFSQQECFDLIQGLIISSTTERTKVRHLLGSVQVNIKAWLKLPSNAPADVDEDRARKEEKQRREDERKAKDRDRHCHTNMTAAQIAADLERHRHASMTAAQIADHQARNQHANMSPAQIAADLERHRHASMTPEQIADHQVRNQRASMSPANRGRAQARDGRRNESYLPVEQQWDLANPCVK